MKNSYLGLKLPGNKIIRSFLALPLVITLAACDSAGGAISGLTLLGGIAYLIDQGADPETIDTFVSGFTDGDSAVDTSSNNSSNSSGSGGSITIENFCNDTIFVSIPDLGQNLTVPSDVNDFTRSTSCPSLGRSHTVTVNLGSSVESFSVDCGGDLPVCL